MLWGYLSLLTHVMYLTKLTGTCKVLTNNTKIMFIFWFLVICVKNKHLWISTSKVKVHKRSFKWAHGDFPTKRSRKQQFSVSALYSFNGICMTLFYLPFPLQILLLLIFCSTISHVDYFGLHHPLPHHLSNTTLHSNHQKCKLIFFC